MKLNELFESEQTEILRKKLAKHSDFQGLEIIQVMEYPGSEKYEYLAVSYDDASGDFLISPLSASGQGIQVGMDDVATADSKEEALQTAKQAVQKAQKQFRDEEDRGARDPEGRLT